jgi:hypothetical protein
VVEHRVASAKPRVQLLVLPQKQTKKQKTNSLNAILVVFILITRIWVFLSGECLHFGLNKLFILTFVIFQIPFLD